MWVNAYSIGLSLDSVGCGRRPRPASAWSIGLAFIVQNSLPTIPRQVNARVAFGRLAGQRDEDDRQIVSKPQLLQRSTPPPPAGT